MLNYRGRHVWNVYFLIDTTSRINIETQKQYENALSKIMHQYRSNPHVIESGLINIITFGNNQAKFIIKEHPVTEPIHLNLKFSGEGSIIDGINLLEESINQIKGNGYYSPVIISFAFEQCTDLIKDALLGLNAKLGFRPFNLLSSENSIHEFTDENYIVLFNNETFKTYNPGICNVIFYENVNQFDFQGEIREEDEINL